MSFFSIFKQPKIKPSYKALDWSEKAAVSQRWKEIVKLFQLGGPSNFRQAILEADKLIGFILKKMEFSGDTLGNRLKSAEGYFSQKVYQGLWEAHKIRNRLVHEIDNEILHYEAKEAIEKFKKALEELKIIKG